jgi:hypothetical protein
MFGHFLEEFTAPIRDEDAFPNRYSLLFSQITPRSDISLRSRSAIRWLGFSRLDLCHFYAKIDKIASKIVSLGRS